MDNALVHCYEELKNAHPYVEILFTPPNTKSLIQALDQGIMSSRHSIQGSFVTRLSKLSKPTKETTVMDELMEVSHYAQCDYSIGTAWDTKHKPVTVGKMFGQAVWKI